MNNNRGNNNRRRGRNNNRPQNGGGQQLNRIDSRARGNAPQLLEKYRKLAQDAHMNGDRVQAEYYLQFADHYFRVIADTRVRQDEQRARPAGANGERWQEQDGEDDSGDFSVEGDFLGFDRPATRREREEQREERPEQAERAERPDRAERPQRAERTEGRRDREERPREDRPRDDRPREDRPREDRPREDRNEGRRDGNRRFDRNRTRDSGRDSEGAAVEALPGEGVPAIEGEPVVQGSDNPFVREPRPTRGLRPRTERRPRGESAADEAPATLDASFLPPSISARTESEAAPVAAPAPAPAATPAPEAAAEAAPAPKKRGRPRKVAAVEPGEAVEG
ncbi:MAG: DUF4167 domain-containing protein [Novosphingobium sp.]|nr:DUF4167 domain-containing protein [Novosphingobium sp.]